MDIGIMAIKAWDRDAGGVEKFDINLSNQEEIKAIMAVLTRVFGNQLGVDIKKSKGKAKQPKEVKQEQETS